MNATLFHRVAPSWLVAESARVKQDVTAARAGFHSTRLGEESPQRILVPVDFHSSAWQALPAAVRYARLHGAQITLLHVIDLNLATYRVDTTRIQRELIAEA